MKFRYGKKRSYQSMLYPNWTKFGNSGIGKRSDSQRPKCLKNITLCKKNYPIWHVNSEYKKEEI